MIMVALVGLGGSATRPETTDPVALGLMQGFPPQPSKSMMLLPLSI
jgi:hypothetical protein